MKVLLIESADGFPHILGPGTPEQLGKAARDYAAQWYPDREFEAVETEDGKPGWWAKDSGCSFIIMEVEGFSSEEIARYVSTLEGIIEKGLPYGHGKDPVPGMLQPIIDFLQNLSNEEIARGV